MQPQVGLPSAGTAPGGQVVQRVSLSLPTTAKLLVVAGEDMGYRMGGQDCGKSMDGLKVPFSYPMRTANRPMRTANRRMCSVHRLTQQGHPGQAGV